jgi:hypothetical protein
VIAWQWHAGQDNVRRGFVLDLATARIDAGRNGIATVGLRRRTGWPGGRGIAAMMCGHPVVLPMLLWRRTVRAIVVALECHGTGQDSHVQPNDGQQAQDISSQGSRTLHGVCAAEHRVFVVF